MTNPVALHIPLLAAHEGIREGQYTHIAPDRTLYIRFGFAGDPGGYVCEMIQLSPDGLHRARSWHWFRDHALWRTTLVREHRVSRDVGRFAGLAGSVPELPWCKDDDAACEMGR